MNAKLIEHKAKKLIGKNAIITMKKNKNEFFPNLDFDSVTFEVKIEDVCEGVLKVKKPSGLKYSYSICDEYFTIESIENG